jgi:hypothetical protein
MGCTDAILQPENAPLESVNLYPINYCDGSPVYEVCPTSGISEIKRPNFSIFPNPANSILNIAPDFSESYHLSIIDLMGRNVYRRSNASGVLTIDLSFLKTGNYLVQITQNNNSFVQKLILE